MTKPYERRVVNRVECIALTVVEAQAINPKTGSACGSCPRYEGWVNRTDNCEGCGHDEDLVVCVWVPFLEYITAILGGSNATVEK